MKSSHFCGLKRFLFYLEHQETLFSSFFFEKQTMENLKFFDTSRGLTVNPLLKTAIFGLLKSSDFVV